MSDVPTDAELVVRAQRGELDAYSQLVERYQQLAIRAAYMVTRNQADAEDVAQEALLKAYTALGQVDPETFRAWLLRIVVNQARNHVSAARRRAGLVERAAAEGEAAQSGPSPEFSMLAAEQRAVLTRALDELREEDRLAIAYRYFFDLSETEMVEALGWPRGTVKSRLSRALGRYRQVVGELALLPVGTFAWSAQAAELAGWSEAQLEHALTNLGTQILPVPSHDLSIALVRQVHALGIHPTSPSASPLTSTKAVVLAGAFVAAIAAAAVFARPSASPAPPAAAPVATPAPALATAEPTSPPLGVGQPQPTPSPQMIVVYGGDLSPDERQAVGQALGAPSSVPTQTVSRAEVAAMLTQAGLPAAPSDAALSSIAVTCQPESSSGLSVHTDHIDAIAPVTYATALLVAGVRQGTVTAAGPGDQSVSGEAALIGALKTLAACTDNPAAANFNAAQAVKLLQLTQQIAAVTDAETAGKIMADTVHAIVTGSAGDAPGIQEAVTVAASNADASLDPALVATVADGLQPFVGQDYGAYMRGYRIDATPADARLAL